MHAWLKVTALCCVLSLVPPKRVAFLPHLQVSGQLIGSPLLAVMLSLHLRIGQGSRDLLNVLQDQPQCLYRCPPWLRRAQYVCHTRQS